MRSALGTTWSIIDAGAEGLVDNGHKAVEGAVDLA